MSPPRPDAPAVLPRWLILLASAAVFAHLLAVSVAALAAPSGPWPAPNGTGMASGPAFAQAVSAVTTRRYLAPLRMAHNYHFAGNRPDTPAVYLEFRLKDETGRNLKTVRLPEENSNFWVRHRQTLLAQALADDRPVQPRAGEVVAAPHQQVRTIDIWEPDGERSLVIRAVPEHLVPRDRPVFRPSEWSLVLARSYARYLGRTHGAASAELIRHTREPIPPAALSAEEPPPGAFDDLLSYFGEFPR
jgi:hypothetical protein